MPSSSLRDAVLDRVAAQWIALGGQIVGEPETTVIDLEALIAVTTDLWGSEPRVGEVALDWCLAYGHAINVSRLKNVAAEIGADPGSLGRFAGTLALAGGPRWPFAAEGQPHEARGKVVVRDLRDPSRLVWRIRAAFGVNARSDLFAALLALPESQTSVAELSRRTRFSKRNVAVAVSSMSLAGVIEVVRHGNGDRVMLSKTPLRTWLASGRPRYIDWVSRWCVVLKTLRSVQATEHASDAVRLVENRAALRAMGQDLRYAALPPIDFTRVGPEFSVAFDSWLGDVARILRTTDE